MRTLEGAVVFASLDDTFTAVVYDENGRSLVEHFLYSDVAQPDEEKVVRGARFCWTFGHKVYGGGQKAHFSRIDFFEGLTG